MARSQRSITTSSKWVYAGNGWPSMVAAGQVGKTDIVVYNHGAGFFETPGKSTTEQLALGTLIKVGDVWRLVELPEIYNGNALSNGGAFFQTGDMVAANSNSAAVDQKLAQLYDDLSTIETKLKTAKGVESERLEKQKCQIFEKFIEASSDKEMQRQWVETLADSASSAYQSDRFTDGVSYLNGIAKGRKNWPSLDYVSWRAIFAEYGWMMSNGDREQRDKAHEKLAVQLKAFVVKYPRSQFSGDALIQLGISYEVNEPDDTSKAA